MRKLRNIGSSVSIYMDCYEPGYAICEMAEVGQVAVSRSSRVWVALQVTVREADNASDLGSAQADLLDGAQTKAVYELTGLVAHIMGDPEEQERPRKKRDRGEPEKAEGHIVAHIKAGRSQSHAATYTVVIHGISSDVCRKSSRMSWILTHPCNKVRLIRTSVSIWE